MPLDPDTLSSIAVDYTKGMTSIRGRRVQRLLKREFAGADHVMTVRLGSDATAVMGLSASGAGLCATDGKGKQASIIKWLHGETQALETRFDLLKDSLPAVDAATVPLAGLTGRVDLRVTSVPPRARALAALAFRALA